MSDVYPYHAVLCARDWHRRVGRFRSDRSAFVYGPRTPGWASSVAGSVAIIYLQAVLLTMMSAFLVLNSRAIFVPPPNKHAKDLIDQVVTLFPGNASGQPTAPLDIAKSSRERCTSKHWAASRGFGQFATRVNRLLETRARAASICSASTATGAIEGPCHFGFLRSAENKLAQGCAGAGIIEISRPVAEVNEYRNSGTPSGNLIVRYQCRGQKPRTFITFARAELRVLSALTIQPIVWPGMATNSFPG
jgi:hypothetical protein